MFLHREGTRIIILTLIISVILNVLLYYTSPFIFYVFSILDIVFILLVLNFFRNPERKIPEPNDSLIYAPADGKVVVIETTEETEYFKKERVQVSIFMSPLNVHVNRNPVSGIVKYYRYHPGQYLVAWHPKSSTLNERTTTVIKNQNGEILVRQIAGAVARRIVNYLKEGQEVTQGSEMGFIKFGSRVDVFLPHDAVITVKIDDIVKGNKTVLARLTNKHAT